MMKKIIGAVLAVLLVLAGVCYDYIGEHQKNNAAGTAEAQQSQQTQQENEDLTKSPLDGKAAPKLALKALDGRDVTIDGTKDNTIYVLNFWATWCPPCRAELPEIQKFASAKHEHVNFYAINMQESPEKIQSFLKENGYELPVLLDPEDKAVSDYLVKYIPTTLIIDAKGIVRYQQVGGTTQEKLESEIEKLKAEEK